MSIKWDKEKIALSVAGSLVTIVLGYLVWRHEQTVGSSNAAAQLTAQQDAEDAQDTQIQQELAALPGYQSGGGGGLGDGATTSGSDADIEGVPTDDNIAAILAAFGIGTPASTTGTTGTTGTGGAGGSPIANGNTNIQPVGGGGNPQPVTMPPGTGGTNATGVRPVGGPTKRNGVNYVNIPDTIS